MRADYREQAAKWYKSRRWRDERARQLASHPMCQCPHCNGKGLEADTVDHIEPHRGSAKLFWQRSNFQSMHHTCHNAYKQSQERGGAGFMQGCDAQGNPLSADHTWYSNDH